MTPVFAEASEAEPGNYRATLQLTMGGDWVVYLWAIQRGKVLECSMAYYIQPLVVFMFGALIYKEKVSWRHIVILAMVIVGIALAARRSRVGLGLTPTDSLVERFGLRMGEPLGGGSTPPAL